MAGDRYGPTSLVNLATIAFVMSAGTVDSTRASSCGEPTIRNADSCQENDKLVHIQGRLA
jgi:hypothetical protein